MNDEPFWSRWLRAYTDVCAELDDEAQEIAALQDAVDDIAEEQP